MGMIVAERRHFRQWQERQCPPDFCHGPARRTETCLGQPNEIFGARIIEEESGLTFDPEVVTAFLS
jgi:hypothetical protein